MTSLIRVLAACACLSLPRLAWADAPWFALPQISVASGVSTLGLGGTVALHNPGDLLGVRGSANFFRLGINFTQTNAHSRAEATFQNEGAFLDVYPWHGNFRVSGGVVFDQNSANYSSTPEITGALLGFITNTHYTGVIGDVHGPISFNPVAPYFGVGYDGKFGRHLTVTADFGAIYQGNGRIALIPTGLLAVMPQWRAQVLANGARADHMIDKMSYYPVVSVQLGYRF